MEFCSNISFNPTEDKCLNSSIHDSISSQNEASVSAESIKSEFLAFQKKKSKQAISPDFDAFLFSVSAIELKRTNRMFQ